MVLWFYKHTIDVLHVFGWFFVSGVWIFQESGSFLGMKQSPPYVCLSFEKAKDKWGFDSEASARGSSLGRCRTKKTPLGGFQQRGIYEASLDLPSKSQEKTF